MPPTHPADVDEKADEEDCHEANVDEDISRGNGGVCELWWGVSDTHICNKKNH